jgi:hypothetical protein
VAQRNAALLRRLARQREELRELVGGEPRRRAAPRCIAEDLEDQALELEVADVVVLGSGELVLAVEPALPPAPDCLVAHAQLRRLVLVRQTLGGQLHDPHTRYYLLRCLAAAVQLVENALLTL